MDSKPMRVLTVFLVSIVIFPDGGATTVTCYECDSTTACSDPFTSVETTCEGLYCTKVKAGSSGVSLVARGCGNDVVITSNGCKFSYTVGAHATVCACRTDKCNHSGRIASSGGLVFLMAALLLAFIRNFHVDH